MVRLGEVASIVRSKNAGPYHVTFDVFFESEGAYEAAVASGVFSEASVAARLGVGVDAVTGVYCLDRVRAVKFSIERPVASGDIRDTDVYGAQQATPLLDLEFEIDIEVDDPADQHPGG